MRVRRHLRSGQSLVEFAVVALVMYMLLAAILTFGHALYVAQGLQAAADLAAREISRKSLPAVTTLETVLADGSLDDVYSEDYLVYDLDNLPEGESFFENIVPGWPLVNQQLATLMIVDRPDLDGDGNPDRNLIRYPGTLLSHPSTPSGLTVGIPLVVGRSASGSETIRWVPVVEEIENDTNPDPFSIESNQQGIVALRINYPFQSASMSSFRYSDESHLFEPTISNPNLANDGEVTELNEFDRPGDLLERPLVTDRIYAGTYGGTYGLGAQGALGQIMRPYRRMISAQAIYRRELFAEQNPSNQ
jgi:hypothetical protein